MATVLLGYKFLNVNLWLKINPSCPLYDSVWKLCVLSCFASTKNGFISQVFGADFCVFNCHWIKLAIEEWDCWAESCWKVFLGLTLTVIFWFFSFSVSVELDESTLMRKMLCVLDGDLCEKKMQITKANKCITGASLNNCANKINNHEDFDYKVIHNNKNPGK